VACVEHASGRRRHLVRVDRRLRRARWRSKPMAAIGARRQTRPVLSEIATRGKTIVRRGLVDAGRRPDTVVHVA